MISFFSEDIDFLPHNPKALSQWIQLVIQQEGKLPGDINYIYCSRSYLLNINQTYLNHHYHTDVITFNQSDQINEISGDLYISVDQVKENAKKYRQTFRQELKRVMIHGILHLLGYRDKTPQEQQEMRKKEEAYLSL